MAIAAAGARILVKEIKEKENRGGVIMPTGSKGNDQKMAEVVDVGPGKYLENGTLAVPRVTKGDKICYNRYAETKITYEGAEYFLITEEDILYKVTA